MIPIHIPF